MRTAQILHIRTPVLRGGIWMTLKTAFLSLPSALVENGHQQFLWAHNKLLFLTKLSAILGNANRRKQQIHIYMTGCLARYQQTKATRDIKLASLQLHDLCHWHWSKSISLPWFFYFGQFSSHLLMLTDFHLQKSTKSFLLPFIALPSSSPFILKDSHT